MVSPLSDISMLVVKAPGWDADAQVYEVETCS